MESTIKSECKEYTIFELMGEISKLKQENMQLKANIKMLHNKSNEKNNTNLNNNNEGGWTEEEFDIVAKEYAMADADYKID